MPGAARSKPLRVVPEASLECTVIFLIVGNLNFHLINPHAQQPT
jgi:hypothetical protein